ncbi:MAG: 2-oxoacid:acceptor oxidoreductase family protein [Candidatus Omnitrophota bacterium]|jgi:2-oxoglutarate ferredoxin oxidoreductase subunit gamma
MKKMREDIICAGFGGQGIMVLGKVLANAGMGRDYNVTWMPSYGAEVRGGTAHCMVKISTEKIANPIVSCADTGFIMSAPSLEKFEKRIKKGGTIIVNTSMVNREVKRKDLQVVKVPFTDEAIKLGNVKVANMIAMGVYLAKKKLFDKDILSGVIEEMAMGRKELVSINIKALEKGVELGTKGGS